MWRENYNEARGNLYVAWQQDALCGGPHTYGNSINYLFSVIAIATLHAIPPASTRFIGKRLPARDSLCEDHVFHRLHLVVLGGMKGHKSSNRFSAGFVSLRFHSSLFLCDLYIQARQPSSVSFPAFILIFAMDFLLAILLNLILQAILSVCKLQCWYDVSHM